MKSLYHDTRDYTETDDKYAALPVGKYITMITKVEEKVSNTSGIPYVNLTIEIIEGKYKGRKLWDILSINSPNPTALSIAKRKLNNIAVAVGALVIEGEDTFKYKEIGVELMADKNDPSKTQVKNYISASEARKWVEPSIAGNVNAYKNDYSPAHEDQVPF